MHEFWLKEKLILIVGLFQYGLVLIAFAIGKLSKLILGKKNMTNENSLNEIKSPAIAPNSPNEVEDAANNSADRELNLEPTPTNANDEILINQPELTVDSEPEVNLSNKVEIAPELLTELKEISEDPATVIDEAIRWWLRRRTLDVLDSSPDRKYRVGLRSNRSQKDLWND
ncbi:MAG: hypothetical protein DCF19_02915 [Pseudanabaena frigida]|uniref:Uncharacterized protein n=1 Tax=Pseudanabaena frigida TaxID=945775 RepID=A0A2W4WLU5_9CYAN|nr:MAG: hypothetical protein DCF19_02915 [Pseudanabaena frigida]